MSSNALVGVQGAWSKIPAAERAICSSLAAETFTMERSAKVWLAGPAMMALFTTMIAVGARLAGLSSPVLMFMSPSIAFALAWMLWWPIVKPKTQFWVHAAIGVVCSLLALALQITLSGR
jgi:hypothetical protein